MQTPPPQADWNDLHGAWMLLREELPMLLLASGVDLKLGGELHAATLAIDEVFRRINSKATLAAAAEPAEEEVKEPEIIKTIKSRDKVG